MTCANNYLFFFAFLFTILRIIVGKSETTTESFLLPSENDSFTNKPAVTTIKPTLPTKKLIFNNINKENNDKYSPNLYTENIFLPIAPKYYRFDRTHESIAAKNNNKQSLPLKMFNILDFNAYTVKPISVNENIKDLIEKNKKLKYLEEPSGGLHIKTVNFVQNLKKNSFPVKPNFPPIDDYSSIWEFKDNINFDTTEKVLTSIETPKGTSKPINLVQVKLKLQRENAKKNANISEAITTSTTTNGPILYDSSITIDGKKFQLGNYGAKIPNTELFNSENAQKLVQNAKSQKILTKKSFENKPNKKQHYKYETKQKPFHKMFQNNHFVATTTEKPNFLIHVDDDDDDDFAFENEQTTKIPIIVKQNYNQNNLSSKAPNNEKLIINKNPKVYSHSNLDYADLILSTKKFLAGTGIPFVTAPYNIKNKYILKTKQFSPRGKYSSKYNSNIKLPKAKFHSVVSTTINPPLPEIKYSTEIKNPILQKQNGYEVSESKFKENRVKPDSTITKEMKPDEQPRNQEIIKYFQDMIMVQLSPTQFEFGHIMENPNGWEDRYERKDLDKLRFQGKVRWGDKLGGYGEHYWDLNHH